VAQEPARRDEQRHLGVRRPISRGRYSVFSPGRAPTTPPRRTRWPSTPASWEGAARRASRGARREPPGAGDAIGGPPDPANESRPRAEISASRPP
jgi:hypothetical protein